MDLHLNFDIVNEKESIPNIYALSEEIFVMEFEFSRQNKVFSVITTLEILAVYLCCLFTNPSHCLQIQLYSFQSFV